MSTEDGHREGERRRDESTARVRRLKWTWTRRIQRAFLAALMERPSASTDDIRPGLSLPPEVGDAVWGSAVLGLAKTRPRLIRRVDHVPSDRPSRHGCLIGEWTLNLGHDVVRDWLASHPDKPDPTPEDDADNAGAPREAPPTPPASPHGPTATHQPPLP